MKSLVKKKVIKITKKLLDKICFESFEGKESIEKYVSYKAGCWNPIFRVEMKSGKRYIFKILNPSFTRKYKTLNEVNSMKFVSENLTLPIPKIIHYNTEISNVGYEYIVMEYVEGMMLGEVKDKKKKEYYYKKMFEYFKELREITVRCDYCFGGIAKWNKIGPKTFKFQCQPLSDILSGGPYKTPKEYFSNIVKIRLKELKKIVTKDVLNKYKKFIEYVNNNFKDDSNKEIFVVHGDFQEENIIVNENGIAGIVDWEWASISCFDDDVGYIKNVNPREYFDEKKTTFQEKMEVFHDIAVSSTTDLLKGHCWFDNDDEYEKFILECKKQLKNNFLKLGIE